MRWGRTLVSRWKDELLIVLGLLGGLVLSFAGVGVLWVGIGWPYQMLMFFPFLLLALAIRRFGGNVVPVLVGAFPFAQMLIGFRDKDDSHLMPVLVVAAWALGVLAGHFFGGRLSRRPDGSAEDSAAG